MAMSRLVEVLPENYGYVLLVGVGGSLLSSVFAFRVMKARKRYEVPPPEMYSATSKEFNCVQRVHQNYLENYPAFMFTLLVGGLECPKVAAASGLACYVARLMYAKGYTSGEPENRRWGAFGHIPGLVLMGATVKFALRMCNKPAFS